MLTEKGTKGDRGKKGPQGIRGIPGRPGPAIFLESGEEIETIKGEKVGIIAYSKTRSFPTSHLLVPAVTLSLLALLKYPRQRN